MNGTDLDDDTAYGEPRPPQQIRQERLKVPGQCRPLVDEQPHLVGADRGGQGLDRLRQGSEQDVVSFTAAVDASVRGALGALPGRIGPPRCSRVAGRQGHLERSGSRGLGGVLPLVLHLSLPDHLDLCRGVRQSVQRIADLRQP